MIEFARKHRGAVSECALFVTETTGRPLQNEPDPAVERQASGGLLVDGLLNDR